MSAHIESERPPQPSLDRWFSHRRIVYNVRKIARAEYDTALVRVVITMRRDRTELPMHSMGRMQQQQPIHQSIGFEEVYVKCMEHTYVFDYAASSG